MLSITADDVSFSYGMEDVLSHVSFSIIGPGKTVILGANGSGKSTLMKLIDGLYPLRRGRIEVNGLSASDGNAIPSIRASVGIVFQDPDSQFVSPVLEEDTAFGPENLGLDREEVERRVSRSLELTGLSAFRLRVPQTLSGGEKERAQLSGVLALSPKVLIFDESFSMLDSVSRREVMGIVSPMRKDHLLVFITHDAEEAVDADTVIIMAKGRIIASGNPHDVLSRSDLLLSASIRPPFAVRMRDALKKRGIDAGSPLTMEELEAALWN